MTNCAATGRQKFFNQGVIFKLASDFPIPDGKGQSIWMFGGTSPSDGTSLCEPAAQRLVTNPPESAMKSCSNEVRCTHYTVFCLPNTAVARVDELLLR